MPKTRTGDAVLMPSGIGAAFFVVGSDDPGGGLDGACVLQEPAVASPDQTVQMPAAPAPAPEAVKSSVDQAVETGDTSAFKEARRRERLELKGLLKTEPSPVKPRPEKPKVEAKAEPPKEKNAGAKQRIAQIDPEIEELQNKLRIRAELKRQLAETERPLEAKPAKPETPTLNDGWKKYKDLPGAPTSDQFNNYEDYLDARAEFIADSRVQERLGQAFEARDRESQTRSQVEQQFRQLDTQAATFADKVTSYQQAHPEMQIHPALLNTTPLNALRAINAVLPPEQQEREGPHHFIVQLAFESETPGEILHHLSDHPEAMEKLWHLAFQSPSAVAREIGRLEAKFLGSTSPAASSASPASKVSQAPSPGTTLGRKAPSTGDPLKAAIEAGDTATFKQLRRQERLAGKR